MRTLTSPLCTLEPQLAEHAREMFDVLSDPAIYEFENAPPASPEWLANRFARLESRGSADGSERWLNWVLRLPDGALAGYVQATVMPNGEAYVAYELASKYWRRGLGSAAVRAMLAELVSAYGVHHFCAVLKANNHRSLGLLRALAFVPASPEQRSRADAEPDELVMCRAASKSP